MTEPIEYKMKKIVCITGAPGFIGTYFVKSCLDLGWYVIAIDRIDVVSNLNLLTELKDNKQFKFLHLDINNLQELYDCDYIVNFAASSHVDKSIINSSQFLNDNVNGLHHLLEMVRLQPSNKQPRLIHISTDECYGDIINGSHTESDLLKPSNPYAASKASGDLLILAWARTYGIKYNIIRPTNNYGCNQYPEKLIPKVCKYLELGRKIPLHDDGKPKRVWLHAQDTCNAILHVIKCGEINNIYNVSGNVELSNIDVVTKIINIHLNNQPFNINDYCDFTIKRNGQDVRYSLDDSKLRKLGWNNTKQFDVELPTIVKHCNQNYVW